MSFEQREPFKVAAVQAAPVFLDREATVEKACGLIREAGALGAELVLFPEGFVPTYPFWVWFIPPRDTPTLREVYADLAASAVTIPSPATDRLGEAAREAGVAVAIGVNELDAEASGATVYNTLLFFGADGRIVGKRRKLIPTSAERLVWGRGDGSTLDVVDYPFGKVAGLICWENYMPLAKFTMYAQGAQILLAPTWDSGEPWISTLRHNAKEGRVYVIGCCSAVRRADVPDRYAFKQKYLPRDADWINPGMSAIVDPDGKFVVEPVEKKEQILVAEIDPRSFFGPRFQLDVAGHYARPDIFELRVNRSPQVMMRDSEEEIEGFEESEEADTRRK